MISTRRDEAHGSDDSGSFRLCITFSHQILGTGVSNSLSLASLSIWTNQVYSPCLPPGVLFIYSDWNIRGASSSDQARHHPGCFLRCTSQDQRGEDAIPLYELGCFPPVYDA